MQRRRRRSRRAGLGALALVVYLLGGTTACTTGKQPAAEPSGSSTTPRATPSSPSPSPSPSDAPVTLRLGVYGGPTELAAYRRVASAYHRRRPSVTVHVESSPDAGTAWQRLGRQFQADRSPDVFLADSDLLSRLVAEDRVQPVDELLEDRGLQFGDRYERLGLEAFAAKSALQCMPSDVSPFVVFYNKRLIDLSSSVQPGEVVPQPDVSGWTWQQFALTAQSASRPGLQGAYLPPQLTTLAPLLRSAGADIVDDDQAPTTLMLDDPASRTALEAVLALARDPRVDPTPEQLLRQDAVGRFRDGRLAMMIGTRALVPQLRRSPDLRFDVYPLPSFGRLQTIADVTGYCISRASEHVDEAADFLAFASGDQAARTMARSGGIVPANLAALRSPAFVQPDRLPSNVSVFTNVIRRAETMPNPLAWPTVVARTQPLIGRLFYDTVLDLDTQLAQIDSLSAGLLAEPTPSPSPSSAAPSSPSAGG